MQKLLTEINMQGWKPVCEIQEFWTLQVTPRIPHENVQIKCLWDSKMEIIILFDLYCEVCLH